MVTAQCRLQPGDRPPPVANLLVHDLIAYQGPGTSYSGRTVAALQSTGLVNTGTSDGGPMDVFSVFDSFTVASNALGDGQGQVSSTVLSLPMNMMPAPADAGRIATSPLIAAGATFVPTSNFSPVGAMPLVPAGASITPVATGFISGQPGSSTAQPLLNAPTSYEHSVVLRRTYHDNVAAPLLTRPRAGLVLDSVLDDLTSDAVLLRGWKAATSFGAPVLPLFDVTDAPMEFNAAPCAKGFQPASEVLTGRMSVPRTEPHRQPASSKACLTDILLAAGFCSFGAGTLAARSRRARNLYSLRRTL